MNGKSNPCDGCCWKDNCAFSSPCEYYYSPGMEYADDTIERLIEEERDRFRKDWQKYIGEYE